VLARNYGLRHRREIYTFATSFQIHFPLTALANKSLYSW